MGLEDGHPHVTITYSKPLMIIMPVNFIRDRLKKLVRLSTSNTEHVFKTITLTTRRDYEVFILGNRK